MSGRRGSGKFVLKAIHDDDHINKVYNHFKRLGWVAGEGQGNLCSRHAMMMIILIKFTIILKIISNISI